MKKIGIIGGGVLGSAIKNYFGDRSKVYDKFKEMDSLDEVKMADVFFVCVPTPYDNGFISSYVDEAVSYLGDLDGRIVVLKSTIIPGTTERLQGEYPNLKILFNPEFLTESTFKEDFMTPDKQIIGYTSESKDVAEEILDMLPRAPYKKVMKSTEAELVKYAVNSYYASKVTFGNFLFDISAALDIDYGTVKEAFVADKRIVDSHLDVFHGGYRGFGGKCLPKDTASLVELAEALKIDNRVLKSVIAYNDDLRKSQGLK